ncbi:MAG: class I SAM-dependent methyltransferase [Deltaproteobacteria bacterium]|nr:class I SAM-dependent methyltransferase [Deltaproteobacteria bacterium]
MVWIIKNLRKVIRYLENTFRQIEGPEFEPYPWHSHYLSVKCAKKELSLLGSRLSGRILDIGAGTGHGARYLRSEDTEYYPTDLPTGRNPLDGNISNRIEKLKIYCSCYALPFLNECMGGTMMISVLEHLESHPLAISEAYHITKIGGYLLITTPFSFPVHGYPSDYRRWTLEGLKVEMDHAGFKVIDAISIGDAFSSLALNVNLLLKYHLLQFRWAIIRLVIILATPFTILLRLMINCGAILLGPLDQSKAFPLGTAILCKKVKKVA